VNILNLKNILNESPKIIVVSPPLRIVIWFMHRAKHIRSPLIFIPSFTYVFQPIVCPLSMNSIFCLETRYEKMPNESKSRISGVPLMDNVASVE
jgi:hypothetical protein